MLSDGRAEIVVTKPLAGRPRLFDLLKQETLQAHERIEAQPRLAALVSPGLDRDEYLRTLDCLHPFFSAIEPVIEASLRNHREHFEHYRWRRRSLPLREDMIALGGLPAICARSALPSMQTLGQLLGALYVLEGATLGGRVIADHLRVQLGLSEKFGARYFHLYLHGGWAALRKDAAIIQACCDPREAATAANAMFTSLQSFLDDRDREAFRG